MTTLFACSKLNLLDQRAMSQAVKQLLQKVQLEVTLSVRLAY